MKKEALFPIEEWDCPEKFEEAGIKGFDPMTAKELDTDEMQDERFNSSDYIVEEKYDGTRALVYFLGDHCRVFSRRISKKTDFYVENTDSLPHIRDIDSYELKGTILDGEMFINGRPFKDVSATLNCKWDKAIDRQEELGYVTFHAFDILFYKGIDLRKMPLINRKKYLSYAVSEANCEYLEEVPYFSCGDKIDVSVYERTHGNVNDIHFNMSMFHTGISYPTFYKELGEGSTNLLSPRAFYEYIVATGGEGLIIKPKQGKYHHKRGWEYSKIKKFLTREMIVIGFSEPTKEYTGKEIKKWAYWWDTVSNRPAMGNFYGDKKYMPVTKHYFYNQVGNLILGVCITDEEYERIPKNKRGNLHNINNLTIMEVCECSGFDDGIRQHFTDHQEEIIGKVVEVKANEIMRDSGRLRHPRYLRDRFDKTAEMCTWRDHVS